jgi:microcystin-dependent protein
VIAYAGGAAPAGWALCDGSLLDVGEYPALLALIGSAYGGEGQTFALPDLRGRILLGS